MAQASNIAATLGDWRQTTADALPERLAAAIEAAVLDGRIAIDARVPSERALADALGVSRVTVSHAYSTLRSGGWLTTRRGAGSTARIPPHLRYGMTPSDAGDVSGVIDLRRASPAAPIGAYRTAMRAAIETITPQLASAAPHGALGELRAGIAERHTQRGVPTTPDEILVLSGAMPALWLVLAALLPPAPRVIVESPTYPGALDALRQRHARVVGWPAVDEWDVDELERLARQHKAVAAYLIPDFHNPTGRLMDATSRRDLLDRSAELGLTLVVDETMIDLDLRAGRQQAPTPLRGENVITLGSLSKTVWDGLRVGWIRASAEVISRAAAHPLAGQLATGPLEQATSAALLPDLDGLIAARTRTLRARIPRLLAMVESLDGIRIDRPPDGGLSAWATLEHVSSATLASVAARHSVLLDPGGRFAPRGGLDRNVRLPFSLPPALLETALDRLAPLLTPRRRTRR